MGILLCQNGTFGDEIRASAEIGKKIVNSIRICHAFNMINSGAQEYSMYNVKSLTVMCIKETHKI